MANDTNAELDQFERYISNDNSRPSSNKDIKGIDHNVAHMTTTIVEEGVLKLRKITDVFMVLEFDPVNKQIFQFGSSSTIIARGNPAAEYEIQTYNTANDWMNLKVQKIHGTTQNQWDRFKNLMEQVIAELQLHATQKYTKLVAKKHMEQFVNGLKGIDCKFECSVSISAPTQLVFNKQEFKFLQNGQNLWKIDKSWSTSPPSDDENLCIIVYDEQRLFQVTFEDESDMVKFKDCINEFMDQFKATFSEDAIEITPFDERSKAPKKLENLIDTDHIINLQGIVFPKAPGKKHFVFNTRVGITSESFKDFFNSRLSDEKPPHWRDYPNAKVGTLAYVEGDPIEEFRGQTREYEVPQIVRPTAKLRPYPRQYEDYY